MKTQPRLAFTLFAILVLLGLFGSGESTIALADSQLDLLAATATPTRKPSPTPTRKPNPIPTSVSKSPLATNSQPKNISSPVANAIAIAAGGEHTCALTTGGGVKCWGYNRYGQLGDGTQTQQFTPVNVSGLMSGVSAIAAGYWHTCALTTSGGVKCWGDNEYGQLGDSTTTNQLTPVNVSGLTSGVSAISAGVFHTCALMKNGGVKCWGLNLAGSLGDGTTSQRLTPVDVSGLTRDVAAIATGYFHTCALMTTSHGIKCWGSNMYGQLGDGTWTNHTTPADVSGLTNGSAIAAGNTHTCALTMSDSVKCWGLNNHGELGDGTTTNRNTPVDVITSGVSTIDARGAHTCALTTSGGLKCWGGNDTGQLGDGTTTQRLSPVDVSGLTIGASAIAAGNMHTCALTTSGGIKCWGYNWFGQLGDGTITQRLTSVNVVGFEGTVAPFLDLPVSYSNFAQSAQGNQNGNGGRVNSWFDHTSPNYSTNSNLTRYDGRVFNFNSAPSQIGVSWYDGHNGTDFQRHVTNEQIFAAASSVVLNTASNPLITDCIDGNRTCGSGYGNQVWLNHGNGYATLYGHLKTVSISAGTQITNINSQPLGIMGNTGRSEGIHLHFGVYYDKNNDGQWTQDEVVDPYGWSGTGADVWSVTSVYLWKYPLSTQQSAGTLGANLTSPSGNANAVIPSGALTTTVTLELRDTSPVAAPSAQLRSTGHSFLLQVLEWLGITGQSPSVRRPNSNFAEPVTLQVTYGTTETLHLNTSQMKIYLWDENAGAWSALPTTIDLNLKTATA